MFLSGVGRLFGDSAAGVLCKAVANSIMITFISKYLLFIGLQCIRLLRVPAAQNLWYGCHMKCRGNVTALRSSMRGPESADYGAANFRTHDGACHDARRSRHAPQCLTGGTESLVV